MREEHNRAFKEWAIICDALKTGRQTVLIRKGGIREEEGVFRVEESEFFLLPTYEHQNAGLLQPPYAETLARTPSAFDPQTVTINAYATVDTIRTCDSEATVNALADEYLWNAQYVKMRFDFNPYDPLYILILRAYRLPEAVCLPMLPAYGGCKSWVTLEHTLSTDGAVPALSDEAFLARRARILHTLDGVD